MELVEAIKLRHSVRQYKDIPIEEELRRALDCECERLNKESGFDFKVIYDEPRAFGGRMAGYGRFENAKNYIALIGKDCPDFDEKIGYYGEMLVLFAQTLGLHTCWVAVTYKKIPEVLLVPDGEKLALVISIGHGRHRGLPRKSKTREQVSNISESTPEWFNSGVESALLAPTAMNQQKFRLTYNGDGTVSAKAGLGFYAKMDLGIVKCHFEIGAGRDSFRWR